MKKLLLAGLLLTTLNISACTDKSGTREILRQNNYTEIEVGGHAFFKCSEDDMFKTKFKAIAPNGEPVKGVVCKGILKGKTIRVN